MTRVATCICEAVGGVFEYDNVAGGCALIHSRTSSSLEAASLPKFPLSLAERPVLLVDHLPVNSMGWVYMGSLDFAGLSFQIRSTRFWGGYTSFDDRAASLELRSVAFSCEIIRASIPILESLTRSWKRVKQRMMRYKRHLR